MIFISFFKEYPKYFGTKRLDLLYLHFKAEAMN